MWIFIKKIGFFFMHMHILLRMHIFIHLHIFYAFAYFYSYVYFLCMFAFLWQNVGFSFICTHYKKGEATWASKDVIAREEKCIFSWIQESHQILYHKLWHPATLLMYLWRLKITHHSKPAKQSFPWLVTIDHSHC